MMAEPASPVRTVTSSGATTPDGPRSASEPLTPRSKVKALLATLDGDSTDESPTERKEPLTSINKDASRELAVPTVPPVLDDEGEKDDNIIIPHGNLARRLYKSNPEKAAENMDQTSDDSNDAYERVRMRLLQLQGLHEEKQTEGQREQISSEEAAPKKFGGFLGRKQKHQDSSIENNSVYNVAIDRPPQRNVDLEVIKADEARQGNATPQELPSERNETVHSDSEPELPSNPLQNERFNALVERKRQERKAREAADHAKRLEKATARNSLVEKGKHRHRTSDPSEVDSTDEEANSRLTQRSRPARKASKKAMEEMTRETQRLSRNMQLAHEAKTRKKITKDSLLERFKPKKNFKITQVQASSSTVNSSALNSDVEELRDKQTPLTTPERTQCTAPPKMTQTTLIPETSLIELSADEDLPTTDEVTSSQPMDKGKDKDPACYANTTEDMMERKSLDKGRAKALDLYPNELTNSINQQLTKPAMVPESRGPSFTQRPIKLRPAQNLVRPRGYRSGSESDLEIVPSNSRTGKGNIFDRLPASKGREDKFLIKLRALAHLSSPRKQQTKPGRTSMTPTELGSTLRRQARQQAAKERAEKIEELRRKGVVIQSIEERQQDQLAVEDMIEKARAEAEALAKKEKEEVKKEKREKGEDETFDSSDDEDYEEVAEVPSDEEADVELSGSEEEEVVDNEDIEEAEDEEGPEEDEEESAERGAHGLIDDVASQDEKEVEEDHEEEMATGLVSDELEEEIDVPRLQRRGRNMTVVDDDDADEDLPKTPNPTAIPDESSILANPFGRQADAGTTPMRLTQAFAATMADSQLGLQHEEDSLAVLGAMTAPEFPDVEMDSIVRDSQARETQEPEIDLHLTQSQIQPDSVPFERVVAPTQFSQLPDPSQDEGFENSSPIGSRFAAPPSTVDTVIIPTKPIQESPIIKKTGRLRQKARTITVFSDEENENDPALNEVAEEEALGKDSANAFDVLKKGPKQAKKKQELFNKQKSAAKGHVEEQAVESEDEYAGLGGASDDSEGEEDEEIKNMINEEDVNVNERKIAAYFAEKSRASDEAAISKLYRDINSGALRRRRGDGADFDDLDDSDDDVEARQRRRRREEARLRKALLEGDSNIGKIAEDPKKAAFLRAIEDREDDDKEEVAEFLENTPREGSQEEEVETQEIIPDSQAENRPPSATSATGIATTASLKRKRSTLGEARSSAHPPANARRITASIARKPTALADIRDSVSFLTEDPTEVLKRPVGPSLFDPNSDVEMDDADARLLHPPLRPSPSDENHIPPLISDDETNANIIEPPKKHPRRSDPNAHPVPAFVDRLSLKRKSSSFQNADGGGKMAFLDARSSSLANGKGFKTPALIRRATSSFSLDGTDENGISRFNGGGKGREAEVKGRIGGGAGGKRSSVNWYAREQERREVMEKRKLKEGGASVAAGVGKGVNRENRLGTLLGRQGSWE